MTPPANSSIPTKGLCTDRTFFPLFFSFFIDNCNDESLFREVIKMKIFYFFTTIYPKININVLKTICLSNKLLMHIRENTDFLKDPNSLKLTLRRKPLHEFIYVNACKIEEF